MRPVPSELGRGRLSPVWSVAWWLGVLRAGWGEAVACLVCCVVVGCFACGAGESCRPFGLLLGGLVWAQESPPQP